MALFFFYGLAIVCVSFVVLRYLKNERFTVGAQEIGDLSPLHRAVMDGDVQKVKNLLYHGARVNIQDEEGGAPFLGFYGSHQSLTKKWDGPILGGRVFSAGLYILRNLQ